MQIEKIKNDLRYFQQIVDKFTDYNLNILTDTNPNQEEIFDYPAIKQLWQKALKDKEKKNYNLAVYIPYCRSRCYFCHNDSAVKKNDQEIDKYLDYLILQMKYFSPLFKDITFNNLYIGGGTPSILNIKQLKKILINLFANFKFTQNGVKSMECNADSVTEEKIKILSHYNFNRLSFGVQSFDKNVLQACNRDYQDFKKVKQALGWAKKNNIQCISVDLMIGLMKDSIQSILNDFLKIFRLEPSTIIAYFMQVSHYNREYVNQYLGNESDFSPRLLDIKRKLHPLLKNLCQKYNYNFDNLNSYSDGIWTFSNKKFQSNRADYNSESQANYSMLGLGRYARSRIDKILNYTNFNKTNVFEEKGKEFKASRIDRKYEMLLFILYDLIHKSKISKNNFQKAFDREIEDNFKYSLSALSYLKQIKIDNDYIYFLPKLDKDRFIYAMFFLRDVKNNFFDKF